MILHKLNNSIIKVIFITPSGSTLSNLYVLGVTQTLRVRVVEMYRYLFILTYSGNFRFGIFNFKVPLNVYILNIE